MKNIVLYILGLMGLVLAGVLTYYVISGIGHSNTIQKAIVNPDEDTVTIAEMIPDSSLFRIGNVLGFNGEEFTPTTEAGVFTNKTNDKLLVLKEDVWKALIKNIQAKFPKKAADCNTEHTISDLSEYEFVGLLTYLANSNNLKKTAAYLATEVSNGNAKTYAGGSICCNCEGEALQPQQIDAVINK